MLNTEKLVKLIKENPDADLMPMVDSEMGNPDYALTLGEIKDIRIDYVRYGDLVAKDLNIKPSYNGYFFPEDIFFITKNLDYLKELLRKYVEDYYLEANPSDEFVKRKVSKLLGKIKWDKVIVLEISDC